MRQQTHGFSLIELLTTLAIIAILTTLSVNTYRQYVLRSYRAEATSLLLFLASKQEQHYANTGNFSGELQQLGITGIELAPRYKLSVKVLKQGHGYELIAEAVGDQVKDSRCPLIKFNDVGQRNNGEHDSQFCWD